VFAIVPLAGTIVIETVSGGSMTRTADPVPPGQATLNGRLTPRQEQILAFIRVFV